MSNTSTLARIAGMASAFGREQPATAARPAIPVPPSPASGPTDRVAAILGHAEAVGREALAQHIANATALPVDEAVKMLASAHRNAHLASAMAGAAVAREALGLPADAARDAAVARGVEAHLAASGLWDAAAARQPSGMAEDDFAAGAAAARRLLGR